MNNSELDVLELVIKVGKDKCVKDCKNCVYSYIGLCLLQSLENIVRDSKNEKINARRN